MHKKLEFKYTKWFFHSQQKSIQPSSPINYKSQSKANENNSFIAKLKIRELLELLV